MLLMANLANMMQKKTGKWLKPWHMVSDSTQQELSNEYQHDRVWMIFINLCLLVHWSKEAAASEGLSIIKGLQDKGVQLSQNGYHANIHNQILFRYNCLFMTLTTFNDHRLVTWSILLQVSPWSISCIQELGSMYRFSWPETWELM